MGRWNAKKKQSPKHAIKRGLASLFVCLAVLLPVYFTFNQWANVFGLNIHVPTPFSHKADKSASRQASDLPDMKIRPIDHTGDVEPFNQPIISVTFDDGWESIYSKAAPLFQKYGIPTTQYVLSGQENSPLYMTYAQIKSLRLAGHEIGCHSIDHKDLTTLTPDELTRELTECKQVIEKQVGGQVTEFAAPYGHTNPGVLDAIKKVFRSERNTNGDITTNLADYNDINVADRFDRYDIVAITIRPETTLSELQSAIDYTVKHNGWLVLNYHNIDDGTQFSVSLKALEDQLAMVNRSSARVATMGSVMNAIEAKQ